MGQPNARRIQYRPFEQIADTISSNIHTLASLAHLEVGDVVDILEIDSSDKILSTIASDVTILAMNPSNLKVTFGSSFSTVGLTGTPVVAVKPIDDSQASIERLYRRRVKGPIDFDLRQTILAVSLDTPSVGKMTLSAGNRPRSP